MKTFAPTTNQKGFTLIELMIVVGIIGILVAIAAPNFSKYQSKARQSEAKIALSAVYGAEKSFYSEYAAYIGSMDAIGYAPEGNKRFYVVGWAAAPAAGVVPGYQGSLLTPNFGTANATFTGCTLPVTMSAASGVNAQTFTANAAGCIRQQAVTDAWNMNDTKVLSNWQIGL